MISTRQLATTTTTTTTVSRDSLATSRRVRTTRVVANRKSASAASRKVTLLKTPRATAGDDDGYDDDEDGVWETSSSSSSTTRRADVFDDRSLAPARRMRYEGEPRGARGAKGKNSGGFRIPRTPIEALRAVVSPVGAVIIAAMVSVANPGFMDSGREAILMKIYEREHGGAVGAYVKDGVLYRMDGRTKSMTANAANGMMVDKNGGIWVIVPQKEDATLIKEKYYLGQIEDVPTLPKNPSKAEMKKYDEYMSKTFKPLIDDLPKDLKKVYDGPYPVPMRKETTEFFQRGGPDASILDEVDGAGALWGSKSYAPIPRR
jgi:hypothetical protein